MTNRDADDQHPISAISGLKEWMNRINDRITDSAVATEWTHCILVPLNTWNKRLFIISLCLLLGMCKLDPNIRKISQLSQCLEVYNVPCPDGIVLGGG